MSSIQCSQTNIRPVHIVFSAGRERQKGSWREKEDKGGEGGNVEGDSGCVGEKEREWDRKMEKERWRKEKESH